MPDAKSTVDYKSEEILEEEAQKYKSKFWLEARDSNFFKCLKEFKGGIHLVYGESDRYVQKEVMQKTVALVKEKGFEVIILKGQDHSPWTYDLVQMVYEKELQLLDKYLN